MCELVWGELGRFAQASSRLGAAAGARQRAAPVLTAFLEDSGEGGEGDALRMVEQLSHNSAIAHSNDVRDYASAGRVSDAE